jgi:hypothetical protein
MNKSIRRARFRYREMPFPRAGTAPISRHGKWTVHALSGGSGACTEAVWSG